MEVSALDLFVTYFSKGHMIRFISRNMTSQGECKESVSLIDMRVQAGW